jgi:hypothetical protein
MMESDSKSDKQATLAAGAREDKTQDARIEDETQKYMRSNKALKELVATLEDQMKLAQDRVEMLERGLEMKSTTVSKIHKIDQDSLEIGAQATGRIKVYGDFKNKQAFAAKLRDAFEVLAGAMEKQAELNGNDKK